MQVNTNIVSPILDGGRLSHAYIVGGGLADTLAMAAVCTGPESARPCKRCAHCDKASRRIHPDISVVDKPADKREIVVEQIRSLKRDVIIVPNEAAKKAYIVNNAELMNRSAQNAFLQILEEPPTHAVFILRTDNPAALLPTVRSRCVEAKSWAENDGQKASGAVSPSAASEMATELFSAISSGNAELMSLMFKLAKLDKDAFAEFLTAARSQAAAKLRLAATSSHPGGPIAGRKLAHADRTLAKAAGMLDLNVTPGHLSGMICASLMKIDA